jgi:hypothetical protein
MAFRAALTDRLRAQAQRTARPLTELQRLFAYDRFLQRLYAHDDGWVLKGAAALLARELSTRHTLDLDVYRDAAVREAERDLRAALAHDLGDWFLFNAGASRVITAGPHGVRIPIIARIGTREWARFHVDLVGGQAGITGTPDRVPALARVDLADLAQPGYRVWPLADHIADKIAATFETHGEHAHPSTRTKDLVDLVIFATSVRVHAVALRRAVDVQVARRDLELPPRFAVPDPMYWGPRYARDVRRMPDVPARTLDEALGVVTAFVDPILQRTASGTWNPARRRWVEPRRRQG